MSYVLTESRRLAIN